MHHDEVPRSEHVGLAAAEACLLHVGQSTDPSASWHLSCGWYFYGSPLLQVQETQELPCVVGVDLAGSSQDPPEAALCLERADPIAGPPSQGGGQRFLCLTERNVYAPICVLAA